MRSSKRSSRRDSSLLRRRNRLNPRLELLEDRNLLDGAFWYAVFHGVPSAGSLDKQTDVGRHLLESSGIPDSEIHVEKALDLTGTFLLETPETYPTPDAFRSEIDTRLASVPGYTSVLAPFQHEEDEEGEGEDGDGERPGSDFINFDAIEHSDSSSVVNVYVPQQATPTSPRVVNSPPGRNDVLVNNNDGNTGSQGFTQSETTIVAFGSNVVLGFNDSGSFTTGGNKFTGFSYSSDGGATFTDGGTLPTNAGGDAGDPTMARDNATGRIYFATLGFNTDLIQVFHSDDNGHTWSLPAVGTPGGSSEDKEWITVDNYPGAGQGNVYLVSRNFGGGNGVFLYRSTDGGNTFGPSGGTFIAGGNQGAFVAVGPDHSVYAFWFAGSSLQVRRSTDGGVTFGAANTVASGLIGGVNGDLGLTGRRNGDSGFSGFRSNEFPHAVVSPTTGTIYVTYNNKGAGSDKADVFVVQSNDGGATWSAPIKVNDDLTNTDQWQPTLAITPGGDKLGIFYYSRQEDPVDNNLFKYYGRVATISGSTLNFAPSFAISATPSLPEFGRDNVVNPVYMGDYNTAVATPGAFHVVWSDNRDDLPGTPPNKDPQVYYMRISLGLSVSTTVPAVGSVVSSVPVDYTVNFTDPIQTSSVQASDFQVDGVNASSFTINTSTQVVFHYSSAPFSTQGLHTMTMPAGAILRASDGDPLQPFSGTFRYDALTLMVTSTVPPVGGVFHLPSPLTYDVNFNEAIDPASVQASDLTLSGIDGATVTGVTVLAGNTTARFTIGGITAEGTLTASIAAGAITDSFGNSGAAFSGSYAVDIGTTPFPDAKTSTAPGSLVYQTDGHGFVAPAGDVDGFTILVDPGQTITVILTPSSGLRGVVSLFATDGGDTLVGTATSPAPGRDAVIQTVAVPGSLVGPGTPLHYRVDVAGAGGTTGEYNVHLILNAAASLEDHGGPPDGTLATAQSLENSFVTLGASPSAGQRGAVLGKLGSSSLVANGSFEAGNFSGWTTVTTGSPFIDWTVSGAGAGAGFDMAPTAPQDGSLDAWNGFDGDGPMQLLMYQDITLPSGSVSVSWKDRVQWNFALTGTATQPRTYEVEVVDPASGTTLATLTSFSTGIAHIIGDSGWQTHSANLSAFAGQTVRLRFREDIPESFTGPGQIEFDGVSISDPNADLADYYSFTLGAGASATVGLDVLSGPAVTMTLLDSSGNPIANGAKTGSYDQAISDFLATAAGTYYVKVTGSNSQYSLVVTRNATLDVGGNKDSDHAEALQGKKVVLGALGKATGALFGVDWRDPTPNPILGLDPDTGAIQSTIFGPATPTTNPFGTNLAFDGTNLWYNDGAFFGSNTIYKIDPSTGAVLDSFFFGTEYLLDLAYLNGHLFGVGLSFTIYEFDPNTHAVLRSFTPTFDGSMTGLAGDPDRGVLWAVSQSHTIYEIDPVAGTVISSGADSPDGNEQDLAYSNNQLFVSEAGGSTPSIAVYDADSLALLRRMPIDVPIFISGLGGDGLGGGAPQDWYSFTVNAGDHLSISTRTPAGDPQLPGQFHNLLDPAIELYDASGNLVASDDNSGGDGKNAALSWTALSSGTYRVRVLPVGDTTGEYVLSVNGATGALPPFSVTTTDPANGATLRVPPATMTVDFNDTALLSSLQASDLRLDGVAATGITIVDGDTVIFDLPGPISEGSHTVTIAAGAVTDLQGTPISAYTGTFFIDTIGPRVTATSVAPGGVVPAGDLTYTVTFSEPMQVSNLSADDFNLHGNFRSADYAASGFSYNAAGTVLTINYTGLPDDSYKLTLFSGVTGGTNFTDAVGNAMDGEFSGTFPSGNGTPGGDFVIGFNTDLPTEAYPAPTAKTPAGSLIYDPSLTRTIAFSGDTDSFTLNVDPGQTISVLVDPAGSPFGDLIAGAGNGSASAGSVILVNQDTGAGSIIADPVTPGGLTGLAYDPSTGVLLGSTIQGGGSTSKLVRIDPNTGALLGSVNITFAGVGISIGDLALQPGTNVLYGARSNADGLGLGGRLYTINKTTGVATFVGDTGAGANGGIAFTPDGSLYQTSFNSFFDFTSLNKLNPADASRISTIPIGGYFDGLAARGDGVLFATPGGSGAVYTLNPTTGALTFVGDTGVGTISDFAFRPSTALAPHVELRDPANNLLASASSGPALNALLQTVPAATGGTYTITVSGGSGSVGLYNVQVILNAAKETEGVTTGGNNTPATAQNIDGSFIGLHTSLSSAQRGAVLGTTDAGGGYTASAVPFAFTDISGTGTPTLQGTDDSVQFLDLSSTGFAFPFYGQTYTSVYFGTNGIITFGSPFGDFTNQDLTSTPDQATIAPFWDDMETFSNSGAVYWQVLGSGSSQQLVLQWDHVCFYSFNPAVLTFQAILSEDGSIRFNYQNLESGNFQDDGASATVGIKASGAQGPDRLLLAFNNGPNAFVGTGQSTLITPVPPAADYYAFTVGAGETITLAATSQGAGNVTLQLRNGADAVLATGVPAANLGSVINNFTVTTAGTYYARVIGDGGVAPYSLVVTKSAAFDTESNDTPATAQPIGPTQGVLGNVISGSGSLFDLTGPEVSGPVVQSGAKITLGFNVDGSFITAPGGTGIQYNGVEFVVPGSPVASFTVAYNGLTFTNNGALGFSQITGIVRQDVSSGPLHGLKITGFAGPSVRVERVVVFNTNDDFLTIATRLTNVGSGAVSNVATLENIDPDQDFNNFGDFGTLNDVVLGGQFVRASGPEDALTVGLGSADPRSVVSAEGFFNTNPFDIINSPEDPNGAYGDIAINQAFNFGASLGAGAQVSGLAIMAFGTTPAAADATFSAHTAGTTVSDTDWYSFTLGAGQTALRLETSTPGDGPGEFANTLNPKIELYDSTGTTLIASGVVLPDGRNEVITLGGLTAGGTYKIRVQGEAGTRGEFFLGARGLAQPTPTTIVDNTSFSFTTRGTWSLVSGGYNGSYRVNAGNGDGSQYAQWQYSQNFTAGTSYGLYVTWVASPANATNARYKIFDGATLLATVTLDQTKTPDTALVGGSLWKQLYVYTPATTGMHVIRVQLDNSGNGNVIADGFFDPPLRGDQGLGGVSLPTLSGSIVVAPTLAPAIDQGFAARAKSLLSVAPAAGADAFWSLLPGQPLAGGASAFGSAPSARKADDLVLSPTDGLDAVFTLLGDRQGRPGAWGRSAPNAAELSPRSRRVEPAALLDGFGSSEGDEAGSVTEEAAVAEQEPPVE